MSEFGDDRIVIKEVESKDPRFKYEGSFCGEILIACASYPTAHVAMTHFSNGRLSTLEHPITKA